MRTRFVLGLGVVLACGKSDDAPLAPSPVADAGVNPSPDAGGPEPKDASTDTSPDAPVDAPIVPTCDGAGLCTFAWKTRRVVVDAAHGGRMVEISLDQQNALVKKDAEPTAFGSTFWTSPQSDWGWPPAAALDEGAYTIAIDTKQGRLTVTSGDFTTKGATLAVEKELWIKDGALRVQYTIKNKGASQVDLAPWEVSRVPTGGLAFFPNPTAGAQSYAVPTFTPMPTVEADGHTFFAYDEAQIPADRKLFADGGEKGYLAYAKGDLLLVKTWTDVPSTGRAPDEGEIEIYANGAHTYVELEEQGAYVSIAPGGPLRFNVTWSLVRLPSSIGSPATAASDATTRAMLVKAATSP